MDDRLIVTFMETDLKKGTHPKVIAAAIERLKKDRMFLSIRNIDQKSIEARFWNSNGGIIIHRIKLPPRMKSHLLH